MYMHVERTRRPGPYPIQCCSIITFSISISLSDVREKFTESVYVSTLVVTGNLPGVYQYSVTNRAMSNSRDDSFTIEGLSLGIHACVHGWY